TPLRSGATTIGTPPLAAGAPCGLVFLDPPYRSGLAAPTLSHLAERGWIAEGAVCLAEVAAREDFEAPAGFQALAGRRCGGAGVVAPGQQPARMQNAAGWTRRAPRCAAFAAAPV